MCLCKKQQKECHCSEPQWQCEDKCGKKLACGYHVCEVICHQGDQCPPCPLSQVRHCPCGKTTYQVKYFKTESVISYSLLHSAVLNQVSMKVN